MLIHELGRSIQADREREIEERLRRRGWLMDAAETGARPVAQPAGRRSSHAAGGSLEPRHGGVAPAAGRNR